MTNKKDLLKELKIAKSYKKVLRLPQSSIKKEVKASQRQIELSLRRQKTLEQWIVEVLWELSLIISHGQRQCKKILKDRNFFHLVWWFKKEVQGIAREMFWLLSKSRAWTRKKFWSRTIQMPRLNKITKNQATGPICLGL